MSSAPGPAHVTMEPPDATLYARSRSMRQKDMPWLTFAIMAGIILVIMSVLGMAMWSETEVCRKGLNAALGLPPEAKASSTFQPNAADINHTAALAYARGLIDAYAKTFSILLSFLLMFAGTIYILLPERAAYSGNIENKTFKAVLETNSPGLVIATLGMLLAMTAVLTPTAVNYTETVGSPAVDAPAPQTEPVSMVSSGQGSSRSTDAPVKEPPPEH